MTNVFYDTTLIIGIISSVSDHFRIFSSVDVSIRKKLNHTVVVQKGNLSSRNIKDFKTKLSFVNWEFVNYVKDPNSTYKEFLLVFSVISITGTFKLKTWRWNWKLFKPHGWARVCKNLWTRNENFIYNT